MQNSAFNGIIIIWSTTLFVNIWVGHPYNHRGGMLVLDGCHPSIAPICLSLFAEQEIRNFFFFRSRQPPNAGNYSYRYFLSLDAEK